MSVDVRTRTAEQVRPIGFAEFHETDLTRHLERHGDLASRGFLAADLRPITIRVDDEAYTWHLDDRGDLTVTPGDLEGGALAVIDAEAWSDLVQDVRSTIALMVGQEVDMERGNILHFARWETVLRALLDARPVHEPGAIDFVGRDGEPLDLHRSFEVDDNPDEMRHFLEETGYLHLRQVYDESQVDELNGVMDRWFAQMTEEDERTWWARTADGERTCVRVTNLAPDDVDFEVRDHPPIQTIIGLPGDSHRMAGIDLLRKPVGVEEGISDLPWHKDCTLGMHSYRCSSLTLGISVTASDESNGRLGAVAGSNRANLPLLEVDDSLDLPIVYLSTQPGDCTVHLSCTLHCATPPKHTERRVAYTSFVTPGSVTEEQREMMKSVRDKAGRDTFAPTA